MDGPIIDLTVNEQGTVQCSPEHVAACMEWVFPLCAQGPGKKWRFIGTAFFLNHFGIFATAKHVIADYIDNRSCKADDALCGIVAGPNNSVAVVPVLHGSMHGVSDVAVGRLAMLKHNASGDILPTKSMPLNVQGTNVGGTAVTFAYPLMEVDSDASPQQIRMAPWFIHGRVLAHFPIGRDRVMLPGNVYETSMTIKGGASGGPVLDDDGLVFGINSTGIHGTSVSYVSSVSDLMGLRVFDLQLPDGRTVDSMPVAELVQYDAIKLGKG